ncbi:MAG: hypothetical protein GOV02_01385, partial [Candidatus Aenigmarchaeota archaeon]|nr:hypothetical protein [Candidatus Aenigmarchaeota archaeon]
DGFGFVEPIKIRGRVPDIIALKHGKVYVIEVKGSRGNVMKGFTQAMHYSHCANYSYLALPTSLIDDGIRTSCKRMGVGLIGINKKGIVEHSRPDYKHAMKSVLRSMISKSTSLKPEDIVTIPKKRELSEKKDSHFLEDVLDRYGLKILRKLCDNRDKDFTITELSNEIGHDKSIVSRTILILIEKNLIKYKRRGTNKMCVINTENSLVKDVLIPLFEKENQIMNGEIPENTINMVSGYA